MRVLWCETRSLQMQGWRPGVAQAGDQGNPQSQKSTLLLVISVCGACVLGKAQLLGVARCWVLCLNVRAVAQDCLVCGSCVAAGRRHKAQLGGHSPTGGKA